jgi:hypothetical protein
VAKLGDVDQATQQFVSAQPYTVGVLLASSNRMTWTPVQEADLFFQLVAAKFTPSSKTVTLWTGAFSQITDVLVRGSIDIPTADARFRYELVRASGAAFKLAPDQTLELSDFVSETVTLRAVLDGTDKVSPVLYPGTQLIGGKIRTTGTYITKQFPIGTAVKVAAVMAAWQPAGSSITVDVDAVNNTWTNVPSAGAGALGEGWIEPRFEKTPYTAANGRIRITLNGGPGARVAVARLRAYSL